nr:hypothetical protein [Actinomycetales bacterium]
MFATTTVPDDLLDLAESQAGVVNVEQARKAGVPLHVIKRLVRDEMWFPIARGVYRIARFEYGWESRAWAGVLIGGTDAMLGGAAAGYLWGLLEIPPETIRVKIPSSRNPTSRGPWVFERCRNLPKAHGKPPRLTLPDAILELSRDEPDKAQRWIGTAMRLHNTSVTSILRAIEQYPSLPGRAVLITMLEDQKRGIDSRLEKEYEHRVERPHGLPRGQRQQRSGRHRIDVSYGSLIVELDGLLGHDGEGRFRDMERDNYQLLRGKVTLRFGWHDVTQRACEVAQQVASVLAFMAQPTEISPCHLCS